MRETRLQGGNYNLVLAQYKNFWGVSDSWIFGNQRKENKDRFDRPKSGEVKGKVDGYDISFFLKGFGKRTKLIRGAGVVGNIQKSSGEYLQGGLLRKCSYEEDDGILLTRYRMVLSDELDAHFLSPRFSGYDDEIKFRTSFNSTEEDIRGIINDWMEYWGDNSGCTSSDISKVVEGFVDFMTIALAVFHADIGNMDKAKEFLKRYEHQPV